MCVCIFAVVQSLSHVQFFVTPWTAACPNSFSLNQWCYLTISSSATPFSSSLQSFPSSVSFPMSQFFTPSGQTIGALATASVLPMNTQGSFPLGLTGFISLLSKDSQEYSPAPQFKSINSLALGTSALFMVQLSHPYMTTGKTVVWLDRTLSAKWCLRFLIHCLDLS